MMYDMAGWNGIYMYLYELVCIAQLGSSAIV